MTFIPFGDRGSQAACEEGMGGLGGRGDRGRGAPGMGPLPSFGVLYPTALAHWVGCF